MRVERAHCCTMKNTKKILHDKLFITSCFSSLNVPWLLRVWSQFFSHEVVRHRLVYNQSEAIAHFAFFPAIVFYIEPNYLNP